MKGNMRAFKERNNEAIEKGRHEGAVIQKKKEEMKIKQNK